MNKIIYGTAWKEQETKRLVLAALKCGFRAIDTANQRKHYFEAAVGDAIQESGIPRKDIFIQTKFTYLRGQDARLPYDPAADFPTQVLQSFESSLEHLHTTYVDSYVLHGPSVSDGLSADDFAVWKAMEGLHAQKKALQLGVSNVHVEQLQLLYKKAKVKPTYVQNRCYAQFGWDKEVRTFCVKHGIVYQGFSILTANSFVLPHVQSIAKRVGKTPAQVVLRFAQQIGMMPLTGTTDTKHMQHDLTLDFSLTEKEIDFIEHIVHPK